MTAPSYVGKSAFAASTGAITVGAVPGVQAGDLVFLAVESNNQFVDTPSGFTLVGTSINTTYNCRLTLFYQVATGADTTTPVADSGDHTTGIKVAYRGARDGLLDIYVSFNMNGTTLGTFVGTQLAGYPQVRTIQFHALGKDANSTSFIDYEYTSPSGNVIEATTRHAQTSNVGGGGGIFISDLIRGNQSIQTSWGVQRTYDDDGSAFVRLSIIGPIDLSAGVPFVGSAELSSGALVIDPGSVIVSLKRSTGVTKADLPHIEAGDVSVVMAFNGNSSTVPTLPSGWTMLGQRVGTGCAGLLALKRYSEPQWSSFGARIIGIRTYMTSQTWAQIFEFVSYQGYIIVFGRRDSGSGSNFTVSYSSDGLNYTLVPAYFSSLHAGRQTRLCDGKFVSCTTNGGVFYRTADVTVSDGGTAVPGTNEGLDLESLAFSGTTYVFVGQSGRIRTAPQDLSTSTIRTSGTTVRLFKAVYGGGRFVVGGQSGTLLRSDDDGVTWSAWPGHPVPGSVNVIHIFYVNGKWMIGTDGLHISHDGESFVTFSSGSIHPNITAYRACAYFDGFWWVSCNSGYMLRSPDCVTWTVLQPSDTVFFAMHLDKGLFMGAAFWIAADEHFMPYVHETPVFTNATSVVLDQYRGLDPVTHVGAVSSADGNSSTVTLPSLSPQQPSKQPRGVSLVGHVSTDVTFPDSTTARLRAAAANATDAVAVYDSGGPI